MVLTAGVAQSTLKIGRCRQRTRLGDEDEEARRHCRSLGLDARPVGRASFADYTLNILHFNDWHSRIEGNNKYESTCSAEEETKGECIGGAGRLVTAIAQERKKLEGQNVLLLNAGDSFQGSLFYITYKGTAEEEFLNQIKPDAVTLGNHEFDDGESALVPYLDKAKFPIVSANVVPNDKSGAAGKIKPSIVLEVGGQKIGIIGAVTNDTPELASPGPNITIADDVKSITAEVEKLKAQGVNKIMPSPISATGASAMSSPRSRASTWWSAATAIRFCPTPTRRRKAPIRRWSTIRRLQGAGGAGGVLFKYLGEFKVVFDDNGNVKEASGDPIFLDKSITPDPAVLARIKELGAPIEALKNKEVAETTEAIDGSRENCRTKECAMGNLVSDAILDRVKGQGVEIVVSNGGGLRASIDKGTVTMGEVLTVLPFQNTLATFQISGKDLVAGLENGVSQVEDGGGRFPQVAGLKYSFDKSVAPNAGRVKSVEVMEAAPGRRSIPTRTIWSPPTTMSARAATATRSSPRRPRTPMITAPASNRWLPTISARTALHAKARRPHHRDRRHGCSSACGSRSRTRETGRAGQTRRGGASSGCRTGKAG